MIPSSYEYLFLLCIYFLIILSLFMKISIALLRSPIFLLSTCGLTTVWVVLEYYGLRFGLWVYPSDRLIGLYLFTVPLEEYIAFSLIHLATISTWTALKKNELD